VFWKTAGAIRDAGYGSILSLIQEAVTAQSPVPLLTREGGPGSRGTKHLRILIPMGINGIMECEREREREQQQTGQQLALLPSLPRSGATNFADSLFVNVN